MTFEQAYKIHQDMMKTYKEQGNLSKSQMDSEETISKALSMQIVKRISVGRYDEAYCPNCDKGLSEFIGDGIYHHDETLSMCIYCGQKIKINYERTL